MSESPKPEASPAVVDDGDPKDPDSWVVVESPEPSADKEWVFAWHSAVT